MIKLATLQHCAIDIPSTCVFGFTTRLYEAEKGCGCQIAVMRCLHNDILNLSGRYINDQNIDIQEIESSLRDTWDETSSYTLEDPSPSSFELDRLATLVLEAQERDTSKNTEEAILPNGQRLWINRPYLAEEIQWFGSTESVGLSPVERESSILNGEASRWN
ncbi:uncharacterized protein ATNIH1004_008500 [Aspergillus tanneri]|uniref:Uncharacterized protein n=1 Tax=Aspergillus tanneri TaxID=1220188 RepID=A0A5M9MIP5_9EURO|nr:uncharacterized protein ATNIH1004_008500 [Aspergillus tanneri]KAA8644299.1 hypothetical protein ATNIH1004_008500 [Aspergillus tanneri]